MATLNADILQKQWLSASSMYQQRIPNPSQAGIRNTMNALFDVSNRNFYNEFCDALVNRIGTTLVKQQSFENPLAVFKGEKLNYGDTVQSIAVGMLKAHTYKDDATTLFEVNKVPTAVSYVSIDRHDQYPISINNMELKRAFVDDFGINTYISSVMQSPINSDEYDEYTIMKQLIGEYESQWGFYKHKLSAAPTDKASGQELLTAIRTYKGKFRFPSTQYNSGIIPNIPVWSKPEQLVLFVTPETDAALDVMALAELFNLDKAEAQVRKIVIDEFPMPNVYALLTTDDFYICRDSVYQTDGWYNPQTMTQQYWLTHIAAMGVNPYCNAVLFTTDESTTIPTTTFEMTALNMVAADETVAAGGSTQLTLTANGTFEGDHEFLEVMPDSATFEITATRTVDETTVAVELNSRTRVDRLNVLHLQRTGLKTGDEITVKATTTYVNPSTGAKGDATDSVVITVA